MLSLKGGPGPPQPAFYSLLLGFCLECSCSTGLLQEAACTVLNAARAEDSASVVLGSAREPGGHGSTASQRQDWTGTESVCVPRTRVEDRCRVSPDGKSLAKTHVIIKGWQPVLGMPSSMMHRGAVYGF